MLQPWLAESHTVSADGLTYTFKLRRGAKFHHGAEVTAEDVRYSIERIPARKKGAAALLATMVGPAPPRPSTSPPYSSRSPSPRRSSRLAARRGDVAPQSPLVRPDHSR